MLDCRVCLMRRSLLGHASRCAVLRMPSFARVLAVAAKGPSMQALVKLAATLRLSLASGSLDGSSCSLTSAAHSSALPDRDASYPFHCAVLSPSRASGALGLPRFLGNGQDRTSPRPTQ